MAMKHGVVGAVWIGRGHIENVFLLEDAILEAIAKPRTEQQRISRELAGKPRFHFRVEAVRSNSSIDAGVVASSNFIHGNTLASLDTVAQTNTYKKASSRRLQAV